MKLSWAFLYGGLAVLCLFAILGQRMRPSQRLFRISESTVTNLPSSPTNGTVRIVTDGATDSDCATGGGSKRVLCGYDGADFAPLGDGAGGTTQTLQQVKDQGETITNATSLSAAVEIGGTTTATRWCIFYDGSDLQITDCAETGSSRQRINTNATGGFFDREGASDIFTIDPDAASTNAMYTFASGYRPLKSIEWLAGAIETDGTECTTSTVITINSGHREQAIVCPMGTANTDGFLYGSVTMPDAWDAGTVAFEMTAVIDNDGGAGTFHGDISCQTVADTETVSASYGTGADLDLDEVAGDVVWDLVHVNGDAALTCSGTPAAGETLFWRWKACDDDSTPSTNCADSTAATITDMSILNVKMEYGVDSLSD